MSQKTYKMMVTKGYLMHRIKLVVASILVIILVIFGYYALIDKKNVLEDIPQVEYAKEPVPLFKDIGDVKQKKKAYFDYLRPAVELQNQYIRQVRAIVESMKQQVDEGKTLTGEQEAQVAWLTNEYRVDANQELNFIIEELLQKIDIIPVELVLVQSANESAWGTSRFAREGYNFFGMWCFSKGCGFVPSRRNEGASHEVAKFDDLSSAMYSYMRNLNRHPAYEQLRAIRTQKRNSQQDITASALAGGLEKYSERGQEYIDELRHMIRINQDLIAP